MSAVLTPAVPTAFTSLPVGVTVPPAAVPRPAWQLLRWTVEQYRDLGKAGLFNDVKTMLIHGEVYVMPWPGPRHNSAVMRTCRQLDRVFAGKAHARPQMAFIIGPRNNPGPDVAVVAGQPEDYDLTDPSSALMIVEVSDSTLFDDTTRKAELYATAGVTDYWVIDLENRQLLVYRDPAPLPAGLGATAYRTHQVFGPDAIVAPLAEPGAQVRVNELFPQEAP